MELSANIDFWIKTVYPLMLILLVIEVLTVREHYDLKETASSLAIAAGATIIATFTKVVALSVFIIVFEWSKEFRLAYFGYESLGWAWWAWLIAMFGDDFSFYWHHRLSHTVRVLWACHIPHHSAKTFNLAVSVRNGWFITLYKPIFWMWLPLIGVEPLMIATALIFNAMYQFFLHSQIVPSVSWYEKLFNTPWVHQVHHSCNIEYLDKNHGGITLIWDRLFGTYQPRVKEIEPTFGVLHPPNSYNPITNNTHEFVNIFKDLGKSKKFKDKLMYIFGPPGWSHDGSSKSTRQLQSEWKAMKEAAKKEAALA